jgi:hypothetical protein
MADGFQRFVTAPPMVEAYSNILNEEMKQRGENPYQTHPSLPDRVAALESMSGKKTPAGDKPSITLIRDVPALENEIFLGFGEKAKHLKPINWGNVGTDIYIPLWQEAVQKHAGVFKDMSAHSLGDAASDLASFSGKLVQKGDVVMSDEDRVRAATWFLGAALATALTRQGWTMNLQPGDDVVLERHGVTVNPFTVVRQIADKKMTKEDWHSKCAEGGFAELVLWQG